MSDLSLRLNLYIYTLQHYEDFPFLANSTLFPSQFFSEEERKNILTPDLQSELDLLFDKKIKEKKQVCTAHDIVPILLKKINIDKIKVSKKDVKRFLKKTK